MRCSATTAVLLTAALLLTRTLGAAEPTESIFAALRELEVLAGDGAREPSLFAADDGRVLLSWKEPAQDSRFALRFAIGTGDRWSEPRTIAEADDLFVNWADFPSVVGFADGRLAAHWLRKNGEADYAYDINLALSGDDGVTWSQPIVPHRDGTKIQHGFVSLLPMGGDLLIAWLDGRNYTTVGSFAAGEEAATDAIPLRSATLDIDGALSDERLLDARTCTCCQTSAFRTSSGAMLAYRDRTPEEVRDIAVLRLDDGVWSGARPLHDDGWQISGCPVNGPAIAADGPRAVVAWFTAADDVPKVSVGFSADGGATFGPPIRVDQDWPLGRVAVVLLADGSALVSYLEVTRIGEELRLVRVEPDGTRHRPLRLAVGRSGRTLGFPRMARSGDRLYLAWTQSVSTGRAATDFRLTVRTALAELPAR